MSAAARRWLPLAGLAAGALLAIAAYLPGLGGPLLLDDFTTLAPLVEYAAGRADAFEVVLGSDAGPLGRPVSMLSFLVDFAATGDAVRPLKATNLALHVACGIALFFLARGMLEAAGAASREGAAWVATWASATWLLAPMLASTVLYVTQRMAILAALFTFVGLAGYVAGRRRMAHDARGGAVLALGSLAACWPLAAASKENGALLPLLALGVEAFVFRFAGDTRTRRTLAAAFGVGVAVPALGALAVLALAPERVLGGYALREFGPFERLLTESRVLWDHVGGLLLLPGASPPALHHDDFVVSTGALSPPTTALALAAWTVLAVAATRARAPAARVAAAGLAIFLGGHLLESTILPLEIDFEHRSYLPGAGVFVAVGAVAFAAARRTRVAAALIGATALVPIGFAAVTWQRAQTWSSLEGILTAGALDHPDSARVHTGLASLAAQRRDLAGALAHLDRAAAARYPPPPAALAVHRLVAYCENERAAPEAPYAALEAAVPFAIDAYLANGMRWLADATQARRCTGIDAARAAVAVLASLESPAVPHSPHGWGARVQAARLLALRDRVPEAIEALDRAVRERPREPGPAVLAAELRLAIGDADGARAALERLRASGARLGPGLAARAEALARRLRP